MNSDQVKRLGETTHSRPSLEPTSRGAWKAVFVLLVLYTVAYLDRQVLTLLVDPIRKDLHATDFQISLLYGFAFVIFFTVCGLPIGWAVDRFPRRLIILFGMLLWSLSAAAGGLTKSYVQLVVCRVGVGSGEASLAPSGYSMLSDLFPSDRLAGAMAVYSSGAIIGGAISLALGGLIVSLTQHASVYMLPLIGATKPWQLVFFASGLPGVFVAFSILLLKEPIRRGRLSDVGPTANTPSVLSFMRRQWQFYLAHFAAFSLFGVAAGGYINWAPTFLMRHYHMPVAKVALGLGASSLAGGLVGMLGSGLLADKLFRMGIKNSHLLIGIVMAVIMGVGGISSTLSPVFLISMIGMVVAYSAMPFIAIAATALQLTTPTEYRGQVSTLFLFTYNVLALGLGPSAVAAVSDFLLRGPNSFGQAIAVVISVSIPLAVLCFLLGMKPMRRAVAAADAWSGPPEERRGSRELIS